MENDKRQVLIARYLAGTATETERKELLAWYRSTPDDEVIWEAPDEGEAERVKHRMLARILEQRTVANPAVRTKQRSVGLWRVAAVLLVGLAVAGFFGSRWWGTTQQLVAEAPAQHLENRFLFLPDSTKVLLRPGSKLEYVTDFAGNTREVALQGEGYFDVVPDPDQPFIIHTGKVKTRVLGTAFTIKTSEGFKEVAVTVQRGKVQVQEQDRLLASLSANEQVVYREASVALEKKKQVPAEASIQWAALDMRFDALPFGTLTARLERRYGVEIAFAHEGLSLCPVSGRFRGTETLEEVLDILCATRNASYKKTNDHHILIEGEGCRLQ